jgi:hypothetical protein
MLYRFAATRWRPVFRYLADAHKKGPRNPCGATETGLVGTRLMQNLAGWRQRSLLPLSTSLLGIEYDKVTAALGADLK